MKNSVAILIAALSLTHGAVIAETTQRASGPQEGKSEKIKYGTPAEPGEFPFFVAVSNDGGYDGHLCGGTLLNKSWVMTAAHCIKDINQETATVLIGLEQYEPEILAKDRVKIKQIIAHPDYVSGYAVKDIALIQLAQDTSSTDYGVIDGIDAQIDKTPGLSLTAIGFGSNESGYKPTVLFKAEESILEDAMCFPTPPDYMPTQYDPETQICAGFGTDHGDSGGPLMADLNGQSVVIGVSSRSLVPPAEQFTKVSYYAPWIKQTIADNSQ